MIDFRIEKDSIGIIDVPVNRLWGAQTQRSINYCNISNEYIPKEIIIALAQIKFAAAKANQKLKLIESNKAKAIMQAANEIISGKLLNEFPLKVWQSGSGTHSNMNVNEVIANRASEILNGNKGIYRLVHPNDDVNKNQSSNDVFSSAMNISALVFISNHLLPQILSLRNTLKNKSILFKDIIKIGRTHLQDAIPITLGQEISGWVSMLDHSILHIRNSINHLHELALGGTAVGTNFNINPKYVYYVIEELSKIIDKPLISASNKFEAISTCDSIVYSHGTLKGLASSIMKIANDVRWLSSGPKCGIGELIIPNNEPGSSIMPGKTNPTQCEIMTMLCCQVMGNDVAINIGGSSGNFELNVYKPMIIHNFLQSARLLSEGIYNFNKYCLIDIKPNIERIKFFLKESLMLVTALNNYLGYDKSSEIAYKAHKENITLKSSALKLGYVTEEQFNLLVDPKKMV